MLQPSSHTDVYNAHVSTRIREYLNFQYIVGKIFFSSIIVIATAAKNSPTDTHFRFAEHTHTTHSHFLFCLLTLALAKHTMVSWSFSRLLAIDKTVLINRPKSITNKTVVGPSLKQFETLPFVTLKAFHLSNKWKERIPRTIGNHSHCQWDVVKCSTGPAELISVHWTDKLHLTTQL